MRLAVITAILASVTLIAAPAALADGDPASDVLVEKPYFQPSDLQLPQATVTQLQGVLAASARAGFPIKVALIASPSDLGTVTSLWGRPVTYAQYLQAELVGQYSGQVLIVMPKGFGLWGPSRGPHAVTSAELKVSAPAPAPGPQLAASAIAAVPLLARAAGHPIPASDLAAAQHTATLGEKSGVARHFSPSAIVALVVGALLIAITWTLSLRARPLQLRSKGLPS